MKNILNLFLAGFLALSACSVAQPSETASIPYVTQAITPAKPPPITALPRPVEIADLIFFNGSLVTMEAGQPSAQALAIRGGLIQAIGSDAEILALQGPDTRLIDLQGHALLPGFIDGHTHILAFSDRMGRSMEQAQETALRYGFTGVNELWADSGYLDRLMSAEQAGSLRLRVNVFPSYNDGILDGNHRKVLLKTWYPGHDPILDPQRFLRIPGIKLFVDGSFSPAGGCWALSQPYAAGSPNLQSGICGNERGDLYWSQDELDQVVLAAQNAGYRVALHAMGDQAIETALNAIEHALGGRSNLEIRHQIEHNSLIRPDQLPRYRSLQAIVSVRGYGNYCELPELVPNFGLDRIAWYTHRTALPGLGIHAYIETDYGWTVDPDDRFAQRSLDPFMQIYGLVTHHFINPDGSSCDPDPLGEIQDVGVERALQMLTIEPAYAVSMEEYTGSLKPGKFADLAILSDNPLQVAPERLKDIKVWMTMVNGKAEYCAPGRDAYCPALAPSAASTPVTLPKSGNLALGRSVTASRSGPDNPAKLAVDGNPATHWGANDFRLQWIEVNLGAPATITSIRLLTNQYPDGNTVHRILVRTADGELSEVQRFEQLTKTDEWLTFTPEKPLENIQVVRIETLESPSWVAWSEIEVLGER